MKYYLYLILCFLFIFHHCNCININNNNNNNIKISNNIYNHVLNSSDNNNENLKLWVIFNSKSNNKIELNKECKKRRLSRSALSNIIDETDLTISNKYIDEILNCSNQFQFIKLEKKSNWLNSISITINNTESIQSTEHIDNNNVINCITSKQFVDKIDIVLKFKKHQPISPIKEHNNKILNNQNIVTTSTIFDQSFYGNSWNGIVQTNIDKLQSMGYDGYGITILILDSGFYKEHEVFTNLNIVDQYNFVDNIVDVSNEYASGSSRLHGTATLSVLAGYKPGVLVGAAYNSSILLGKTEDIRSETPVEEDNWIAAIEWGERLGASLVTSSLGYSDWYSFYQMDGVATRLSKVTDIATEKGMVIVNSAGNSGVAGIGEPADSNWVISTGAISSSGYKAPFSSVGPSADGRVKPDVMALGVSNYVATSQSAISYSTMSGTSFSCPLIASGVALLMQAHPDWSPKQIHQAVLGSGSLRNNTPNVNMGFGIFNALNAFNFNPLIGNCSTNSNGCSNHGGCCNDVCTCSLNYYGEYCQYERISCTKKECIDRNGKCQFNKFNSTYTCVSKTNVEGVPSYDPRDVCPICTGSTFSSCGICGGTEIECLALQNKNTSLIDYSDSNSNSVISGDEQIDNDSNISDKKDLIIGITVGVGGFLIITIVISLIIIKSFYKNNRSKSVIEMS